MLNREITVMLYLFIASYISGRDASNSLAILEIGSLSFSMFSNLSFGMYRKRGKLAILYTKYLEVQN